MKSLSYRVEKNGYSENYQVMVSRGRFMVRHGRKENGELLEAKAYVMWLGNRRSIIVESNAEGSSSTEVEFLPENLDAFIVGFIEKMDELHPRQIFEQVEKFFMEFAVEVKDIESSGNL